MYTFTNVFTVSMVFIAWLIVYKNIFDVWLRVFVFYKGKDDVEDDEEDLHLSNIIPSVFKTFVENKAKHKKCVFTTSKSDEEGFEAHVSLKHRLFVLKKYKVIKWLLVY